EWNDQRLVLAHLGEEGLLLIGISHPSGAEAVPPGCVNDGPLEGDATPRAAVRERFSVGANHGIRQGLCSAVAWGVRVSVRAGVADAATAPTVAGVSA